jgi:toxin FitB
MSYLLDTNIICELVKIHPSIQVKNWINSQNSYMLFISVITLGEIRKGVSGIRDIKKQEEILNWLEIELPNYFADRVLPIDAKVADIWGQMQSRAKDKIIPAIDALIAATAKCHNLKLVTRNVKDFVNSNVELINLFSPEF